MRGHGWRGWDTEHMISIAQLLLLHPPRVGQPCCAPPGVLHPRVNTAKHLESLDSCGCGVSRRKGLLLLLMLQCGPQSVRSARRCIGLGQSAWWPGRPSTVEAPTGMQLVDALQQDTEATESHYQAGRPGQKSMAPVASIRMRMVMRKKSCVTPSRGPSAYTSALPWSRSTSACRLARLTCS